MKKPPPQKNTQFVRGRIDDIVRASRRHRNDTLFLCRSVSGDRERCRGSAKSDGEKGSKSGIFGFQAGSKGVHKIERELIHYKILVPCHIIASRGVGSQLNNPPSPSPHNLFLTSAKETTSTNTVDRIKFVRVVPFFNSQEES